MVSHYGQWRRGTWQQNGSSHWGYQETTPGWNYLQQTPEDSQADVGRTLDFLLFVGRGASLPLPPGQAVSILRLISMWAELWLVKNKTYRYTAWVKTQLLETIDYNDRFWDTFKDHVTLSKSSVGNSIPI